MNIKEVSLKERFLVIYRGPVSIRERFIYYYKIYIMLVCIAKQ